MPKTNQTPSSVLLSLMKEYQQNPFSLSKEIHLSPSSVRQLVAGKAKVTVPTALRLAKHYGKTPGFWLDLQRDAELSEAQKDSKLMAIIKGISKAKKPAPKAKAPVKAKAKAKTGKKAVKASGSKPASRGRKVKKPQ